jgi:HEAT repeat protein
LWGALGANVGGPAAAAAFFKEASWHLDLVRRCDGSFTYDGGEQYGPGRTDDNTYYGKSSYDGLSPTASYVLTYSLPLKKLCITGKDANPANLLSKKEVADAVASGRFDTDRKQKSVQELVAAFGDWSPIVRGWAAEELARRPEARAMVPELIAMAEGKDVHVSQGACEALGYIKSEQALPALVRQLSHQDRWVRYKAAKALRDMGGEARPAAPNILKAVAQTAEPLQPIAWADPIQFTHGQLAAALFAGGLTDALKGIDPKLLYPAIGAISRNADGMARATLRGFFENKLTLEDVQALAPDLLAAVNTLCPADTMFGNEIRMGALKALTKFHYKEGIEAGVIFAKTQGGHGSESRTGEIMKVIVSYGKAARQALPGLKELIVQFNDQCKAGEYPAGELNDRRVGAVEAAIKAIEAATTQPELRSIAPVQPKRG